MTGSGTSMQSRIHFDPILSGSWMTSPPSKHTDKTSTAASLRNFSGAAARVHIIYKQPVTLFVMSVRSASLFWRIGRRAFITV